MNSVCLEASSILCWRGGLKRIVAVQIEASEVFVRSIEVLHRLNHSVTILVEGPSL